jgi:hypothetical protein
MPVDHHVIRYDAQGEDWPDEWTVAVIEAARQSARECTEAYERIMGLLAEGWTAYGPRPPDLESSLRESGEAIPPIASPLYDDRSCPRPKD